jgi:hypothetical protein
VKNTRNAVWLFDRVPAAIWIVVVGAFVMPFACNGKEVEELNFYCAPTKNPDAGSVCPSSSTHYCETLTYGDVDGAPYVGYCQQLPAPCVSDRSCGCLLDAGLRCLSFGSPSACTQSGPVLTVTCP